MVDSTIAARERLEKWLEPIDRLVPRVELLQIYQDANTSVREDVRLILDTLIAAQRREEERINIMPKLLRTLGTTSIEQLRAELCACYYDLSITRGALDECNKSFETLRARQQEARECVEAIATLERLAKDENVAFVGIEGLQDGWDVWQHTETPSDQGLVEADTNAEDSTLLGAIKGLIIQTERLKHDESRS